LKLPQYACHKQVGAAKITHVALKTSDNTQVVLMLGEIVPSQGIDVDHVWYEKHDPRAGGYLVEYADGYLSYSPAEAFEQGYRLMDPQPMTNGEALVEETRKHYIR
jgi:hypothetical protein